MPTASCAPKLNCKRPCPLGSMLSRLLGLHGLFRRLRKMSGRVETMRVLMLRHVHAKCTTAIQYVHLSWVANGARDPLPIFVLNHRQGERENERLKFQQHRHCKLVPAAMNDGGVLFHSREPDACRNFVLARDASKLCLCGPVPLGVLATLAAEASANRIPSLLYNSHYKPRPAH